MAPAPAHCPVRSRGFYSIKDLSNVLSNVPSSFESIERSIKCATKYCLPSRTRHHIPRLDSRAFGLLLSLFSLAIFQVELDTAVVGETKVAVPLLDPRRHSAVQKTAECHAHRTNVHSHVYTHAGTHVFSYALHISIRMSIHMRTDNRRMSCPSHTCSFQSVEHSRRTQDHPSSLASQTAVTPPFHTSARRRRPSP